MRAYVVQSGEHLAAIASRLGFDAAEVWEHEANRELRERRGDPHVLAAGDVLFVPSAAPPETAAVSPRTTNRYTATVPMVGVDLQLSSGGAVHANTAFVVSGLATPIEGTSDGDGRVRFEVPAYIRHIGLELPELETRIELALGALDPVDTDAGARARLANLGYLMADGLDDFEHPDLPPMPGDDDDNLVRAILAFQGARELPLSGVLDEATREALLDEHGA